MIYKKTSINSALKKLFDIPKDDVSKFLPPGFNLGETTSSTTESSTSLLHDVLSTLDKKEKSCEFE